jgi:hypothetical protein
MERMLAMLASLVVTVAPGGSLARAADPAPLDRLLVAVADGGQAPPVTLVSHLRLADPAATVVVVRSDGSPVIQGPFRISVDPGTAVDLATALRIAAGDETGVAAPLTIPLPDLVAGDGLQVTVVEVLGGPSGIVAHRIGDLRPVPDELRLPAWRLPDPGTDAVALEGAWWSLAPGQAPDPATVPATDRADDPTRELRDRLERTPIQEMRRLVDASIGDVTGDGLPDVALSFRRLFRPTFLNASEPPEFWTDAEGLSAHVGLFRPDDLSSIWVAGTLVRPVVRLAACDGALAVTYSTLDRPDVVAASVWDWQGFGFMPLPELPGAGAPTCIDIDRDGRTDAAIVERS